MKRMVLIVAATLLTTLLLIGGAAAQSWPSKYDSTASTNATLVWAGNALLKVIVAGSTAAAVYYLKFYDKQSTPACGTDPVVFKLPVPGVATGTNVTIPVPDGLQFQNGIGFCLTGAAADSDTTVAATGVTISLGVKH
jgi:hypothetical protein